MNGESFVNESFHTMLGHASPFHSASLNDDDSIAGMGLFSGTVPWNETIALDLQENSHSATAAARPLFEVTFEGQVIGVRFVPEHFAPLDISVQMLFQLLRSDLLPKFLGAKAQEVQLVLAFENADEPLIYETDDIATDMNLGDYQELAALANQLDHPPRFELLYRESLTYQLARLRDQEWDSFTDSGSDTSMSLDNEWSVPATSREVSMEAREANSEPNPELDHEDVDLGQPVVLFAPIRRVTRSMARAEAAAQEPAANAAAPRPKRTIRKVVFDYADIIKGPAAFA